VKSHHTNPVAVDSLENLPARISAKRFIEYATTLLNKHHIPATFSFATIANDDQTIQSSGVAIVTPTPLKAYELLMDTDMGSSAVDMVGPGTFHGVNFLVGTKSSFEDG